MKKEKNYSLERDKKMENTPMKEVKKHIGDLIKIIIWILIIMAISLFLIGFVFKSISNTTCEKLCDKKNALAHQVFYSGDWKLNDICSCIFSNEIKAWRMG